MRRQLHGQLLPLAHEPRHLLLGGLALAGDGPDPVAVLVEVGIAERLGQAAEPLLEIVDLALDVLQPAAQLAYRRGGPSATGRLASAAPLAGRRRCRLG